MSLTEEVATFLTREARMLDDGHYEEWAALFAEDGRYWMPVDPSQEDPSRGVAHIHDDHAMLAARMHRVANPRAFAAEPAPATVRIVGSVEAEGGGGGVTARSNLILMEHRERDTFEADTRTFGARVEHRLRREAEGFVIARKRVDVLGASGSFNALAVPF